MINVRELITDPDFCQKIKVTRTKAEIYNYVPRQTQTSFFVTGIITIADDKDLQMLPQADRLSGAINVFTEQELYVTHYNSEENQAYISDIIDFEGETYKVAYQLGDMQYGFCRSTCVRMERS